MGASLFFLSLLTNMFAFDENYITPVSECFRQEIVYLHYDHSNLEISTPINSSFNSS